MIYLVRHGQTSGNKAKVMQGRSNLPLTEEGIHQAEAARAFLEKEGIRLDKVYTSPLTRAMQTARIVGGEDCPVTIEDRLIEMDYGPYEGMSLDSPAPEVMAFFRDFAHVPAPKGMEPLEEVVKRLGRFLEEIREEAGEKNILISTHAIAMKGALEYLTPASQGGYWSKYIGNCDIYVTELTMGAYGIPYRIFSGK